MIKASGLPHATEPTATRPTSIGTRRAVNVERVVTIFARLALGAAFLSAVASRFGLWNGNAAAESFREFVSYTAEVNAFLPHALIPVVAWCATVCEVAFGLALILGIRVRIVAACSGVLLLGFGIAMAISQGVKEPLDYSVFSAAAAAFLLSQSQLRREGSKR